AVGAAARASLPVAIGVLGQAAAAGLDVGDLLERTRVRELNATAFTDAYRRYCWPAEGLTGVRIAPFQVLAAEGAVFHERPHAWHLGLADRLAATDPEFVAPTRHVFADTTDPGSVSSATSWWSELTAAGGEGMVGKPGANLTRGRKGLVQPGLKVRGREYLRIIYGPDYTEPANLERLRSRGLGHKRALALREYALGLEALDRAVRGGAAGAGPPVRFRRPRPRIRAGGPAAVTVPHTHPRAQLGTLCSRGARSRGADGAARAGAEGR